VKRKRATAPAQSHDVQVGSNTGVGIRTPSRGGKKAAWELLTPGAPFDPEVRTVAVTLRWDVCHSSGGVGWS
jgi:hypothetical protein